MKVNKPVCLCIQVIVKGSILCRFGVLMLKKGDISVLGGEVDNITQTHSQLSLLRRNLYVVGCYVCWMLSTFLLLC